MAEGTVQVAPDSTGKIIRTQEVTEGGKTVEQQVVTIAKADGTLIDSSTVSVSNFPATQAISATSLPLPTGAATDAELVTIAADIAAQAKLTDTQPVSLASQPLPTGASTEATLALIKAKTDNLDVALSTRSKPADQQHVIVDTITPALALDATVNGLLKPASTLAGVTTVAAVTAITNPLPAGTNLIGHVDVDVITPPTLTKGTQGSTGFSTQDIKDAGRTQVTLYLDAITGTTSDTLATMNITKGASTVTPATSYQVTAGKTFRISGMHTSVKNSSAVASDSRTRLRQAASSLSNGSPIILINEAGTPAAVAQAVGTDDTVIPDGLEIAGAQFIGISHIESATTCTVSVVITGFEY